MQPTNRISYQRRSAFRYFHPNKASLATEHAPPNTPTPEKLLWIDNDRQVVLSKQVEGRDPDHPVRNYQLFDRTEVEQFIMDQSPQIRCFEEMLPRNARCKLYFDYDKYTKDLSQYDKSTLHDELIQAAEVQIRQGIGMCWPELEDADLDIVVMDATIPDKISFHFVVLGYSVSSNLQVKELVRVMKDTFRDACSENFDLSCYSRWQAYRTLHSRKLNKNNTLRLLGPARPFMDLQIGVTVGTIQLPDIVEEGVRSHVVNLPEITHAEANNYLPGPDLNRFDAIVRRIPNGGNGQKWEMRNDLMKLLVHIGIQLNCREQTLAAWVRWMEQKANYHEKHKIKTYREYVNYERYLHRHLDPGQIQALRGEEYLRGYVDRLFPPHREVLLDESTQSTILSFGGDYPSDSGESLTRESSQSSLVEQFERMPLTNRTYVDFEDPDNLPAFELRELTIGLKRKKGAPIYCQDNIELICKYLHQFIANVKNQYLYKYRNNLNEIDWARSGEFPLKNQIIQMYSKASSRVVGKRLSDIWAAGITINPYARVVFDPHMSEETAQRQRDFNMFKGLKIQRDLDRNPVARIDMHYVQPFLDHLRRAAYSDGDIEEEEKAYQYLLKTYAHLVQRPCQKIPKFFYIEAKQGAGKTALLEWVHTFLGRYYYQASGLKQLERPFNGYLLGKSFLAIDEASGVQERRKSSKVEMTTSTISSKVRDMVTRDEIDIEMKGLEVLTIKNNITMFTCSDQIQGFSVQSDSRRDVAFRFKLLDSMNHNEIQSRKRLVSQQYVMMAVPEYVRHIFAYLLTIDISRVDWKDEFQTSFSYDLRMNGLSAPTRAFIKYMRAFVARRADLSATTGLTKWRINHVPDTLRPVQSRPIEFLPPHRMKVSINWFMEIYLAELSHEQASRINVQSTLQLICNELGVEKNDQNSILVVPVDWVGFMDMKFGHMI